ncbi:MAG: ABC transporter permease [Gammaproteobacteria bacterium]|nr:ABC transporter permease [Gammaproteobacteria bacterium]
MAVDPIARGGAALLGWRDLDAAAGRAVHRHRHHGRLPVGVVMIGVDPGQFWSQIQAAVDVRDDVFNGVIKASCSASRCRIAVFEGYEAPADRRGVSGATTRTVVTSARGHLALDFILTAFMFHGIR